MRIAGIIAEYNPLHNGHAYHIQKTREETCCDYIIAVMSGSFVQRGEPAAYSKFERTRMALGAGVDIVLELPVIFSLQAAKRFAFGGVMTLKSAGVNVLSFGSGCADEKLLNSAAELLRSEGGEFSIYLREALDGGATYARALSLATEKAGESTLCEALREPNFMLGAQYAACIKNYATDMEISMIERKGAKHDATLPSEGLMSAAAIRNALRAGDIQAVTDTMPQSVAKKLESHTITELKGLEKCILYKLRTTDAKTLEHICGFSEGLENLMLRGAYTNSLDGLLDCVKSKRYTMARIKRALCCVLLDIDTQFAAAEPRYLRVLGIRKEAAPLLGHFELPTVCKKADIDCLPENAKTLIQKDMLATDLRELASGEGSEFGADFTQRFIVV